MTPVCEVHLGGKAALVEIVDHRIADRHAEGGVGGLRPALLVAAGEEPHGGERAIRDVVECGMVGEPRLDEEIILQRLARELLHQLRALQHLAMGVAVAAVAERVPALHAVAAAARARLHEEVGIGQALAAALQRLPLSLGEMHEDGHGPHTPARGSVRRTRSCRPCRQRRSGGCSSE